MIDKTVENYIKLKIRTGSIISLCIGHIHANGEKEECGKIRILQKWYDIPGEGKKLLKNYDNISHNYCPKHGEMYQESIERLVRD